MREFEEKLSFVTSRAKGHPFRGTLGKRKENKPVPCYLREDLFKLHPEWVECPIVNTNPDNIKEQLIRLIKDETLRQELGKQGVEYVKKYRSLEAIAPKLDEIYQELWNKPIRPGV